MMTLQKGKLNPTYHKTLQVTTVKYPSDYRKHTYELVDESKKLPNRIFIHKGLATKVIMDCGKTAAQKFRTRLGFRQYDVILTKQFL